MRTIDHSHYNTFIGWIKKKDLQNLQINKLNELYGLILNVEPFLQAADEGQYYRGTLLINYRTNYFPYDQSSV
jgi:hypothetical protein